ncbi:MAG: hypothetical protein V2G42_09160 [bacterium JZ-2024 1]
MRKIRNAGMGTSTACGNAVHTSKRGSWRRYRRRVTSPSPISGDRR